MHPRLPKYSCLRDHEIEALKEANILNGCGPQSWKGKGPNWLFKADCFEHDYNYAAGGTQLERLKADVGFYGAMLDDVQRLAWWRRPLARVNAWLFYRLVRSFGEGNFSKQQPQSVTEMIKMHRS